MAQLWLGIGAAFGLLGVAAGAFGAHALRGRLGEDLMAIFRTAVEYQFYHVAALLTVGLLARQSEGVWLTAAGWSFAIGVLVFSGSLYILALSGVRTWGAVTPIGGLALMIGWLCLLVHVARI